jgi:hypothetical protein
MSHIIGTLIIESERIILSDKGRKLLARIGVDKQTGKESLVYYPVRSIEYINDGWNLDVDEEHQIPTNEAIDLMYGKTPYEDESLVPVSIRLENGKLVLGLATAEWEYQNGEAKLLPIQGTAVLASDFEEFLKRKDKTN